MSVSLGLAVSGGARIARKGLERMRAVPPVIARSRIRTALTRAKAAIIKYPPPLPRQRYRRTGTYRRAWKVTTTPTGGTLTGQAVDKRGRDYTIFVGGDYRGFRQARVHKRRWVVARDALKHELDDLPRSLDNDLVLFGRREGLPISGTVSRETALLTRYLVR